MALIIGFNPREFDWRNFLLLRGELVGLGICLGTTLLLTGLSLFWPGRGFFTSSGAANAEDLRGRINEVANQLAKNQPTEFDNPPPARQVAIGVASDPIGDRNKYQLAELFLPARVDDRRRKAPGLMIPNDGAAAVVLAQLRRHIFDKDLKHVMVLMPRSKETVKFAKLGDLNKARLADSVLPLRMAILSASFPYRAQVEEFMRRLRSADPRAVVSEVSPATGQQSFRFLGILAQRRIIDSLGNELLPWHDLDLEGTYRPLIGLNGKRFEPEDERLAAICFPGLVMPRLLQFRENQYPAVELRVKNLLGTLESLKAKPPEKIVGPVDPFQSATINVFAPPGASGKAGPNAPRRPAPLQRPLGQGEDGDPGPTGGKENGGKPGRPKVPTGEFDGSLPEHCLVRLIDVTIEPGKIYQYRIKVRMANPNYQRSDVASPTYAADKELTTDRWYVVPDKVVVPPELLFYAVDQKLIDGAKDDGPRNDRQTTIQIHKWLENADGNGGTRPVGEWVVAERLQVCRGEFISRKVRCEVPEWKTTREEFILASESKSKAIKQETGITVDFSQPGNDAVLVDFEGGKLTHSRVLRMVDGQPISNAVKDEATVEVLMLSPAGRLLSRNSAADCLDRERVARLKTYRQRVTDVREGKASDRKNHGDGGSPFGK